VELHQTFKIAQEEQILRAYVTVLRYAIIVYIN